MAGGFRYPATMTTGAYRYNAPTIGQYESFFNPIPIDFIQSELDKRQNRYDAAYAGSLAARDELSNVQVGLADLGSKNQIISQGIGDISKMVEEKYGGDWGRASKEVARNISNLRANPFWNAQKEAQKQRDIAQELKIKYGSNAMIFNDPTNLSVLDNQGRVRDFSQFQPDIVEKGDWLKTARELLAGLTPDQIPIKLTEAEYGYLRSGNIKKIDEDKLNAIISDPTVQASFLARHPEIQRLATEGSAQMRGQFGIGDLTPEEFAQQQLYGAGRSALFSQADYNYNQNWLMKQQMEDQKRLGSLFGPEFDLEEKPTGFGMTPREIRRAKRGYFDKDGNLGDRPTNVLTETEQKRINRLAAGQVIFNEEQLKAEQAQIDKELRLMDINSHPETMALKQMRETIGNVRRNNPDLTKGLTDLEVFEAYSNNIDKFKHTIDVAVPLLNEDVNVNIGRAISGNINSTSFYLDDGSKVTNNWNDKGGLGEETGIPAETLATLLENGDIPMGYNIDKAQLYLQVPKVRELKKNADGSINWKDSGAKELKRVYFSPSKFMKGNAAFIQNANALLKNPQKINEFIASLPSNVEFDKEKYNPTGDVNNQEVFIMKDEDGNLDHFSLNQLRSSSYDLTKAHLGMGYSNSIYEEQK